MNIHLFSQEAAGSVAGVQGYPTTLFCVEALVGLLQARVLVTAHGENEGVKNIP
jgi:hypothetical protein